MARSKKRRRATKRRSTSSTVVTAAISTPPEQLEWYPQGIFPRSRELFSKAWDSEFLKFQKVDEDGSSVGRMREMISDTIDDQDSASNRPGEANKGNDLTTGLAIFLNYRYFDEPVGLVHGDEIEEFCRGVEFENLVSGSGDAGYRRAAWLDDRQFCNGKRGGNVREHQNPLTATSLYRDLNLPRSGNHDLVDADRRIIYVRNLDPFYVLALTETALPHQVSALRDAMGKHIGHQTSIRVRTNRHYQLSLHLPYFELRRHTSPGVRRNKVIESLPRASIDPSFLDVLTLESTESRKYAVHEAMFSLSICGVDDRHYVAYAFVDRDFDENEDINIVYPYRGIQEDPVASDCGYCPINANLPYWDPRIYFLNIFKTRITMMVSASESLVQTFTKSVSYYEDLYPTLSQRSGGMRTGNTLSGKQAFDWNQKAMRLLGKRLHVLTETVKAWEVFRSPDGDSGYFSDAGPTAQERQHVLRMLRDIDAEFQTLRGIESTLLSLKDRCQYMSDALDLYLTVEGNEALRHTIFTTEWTIQVFSPIALTIAFFSMPARVLNFEPDRWSFITAIFGLMLLVRLLFDVFGGRWKKTWWWKWIHWCLPSRIAHADELDQNKSRGRWLRGFRPARGPHLPPDPIQAGIELVNRV